MSGVRFALVSRRQDTGITCYEIRDRATGKRVGVVQDRRGGYWTAWGDDGRKSSSWCRSRAEAVAAVT